MKPILSLLALVALVACDAGMATDTNANAAMAPGAATAETATLGNTVIN